MFSVLASFSPRKISAPSRLRSFARLREAEAETLLLAEVQDSAGHRQSHSDSVAYDTEICRQSAIKEATGIDQITPDLGNVAYDLELDNPEQTSLAERRLLRKLDKRIIPLTALLYLSGYLDRGNLGNARLQALNGSDARYSIALASFFVTYSLLAIPGTLLATAILPSTSIGIGALIWSIAATSMAGVHDFGGLVACRLIVGVGEAMFGQAVALHYSLWYRKDEMAKRLALFIGAGSLAGAFGGLIAFGVSSIARPAIERWRILFLIEGAPSFCLALVVLRYLPSRPDCSDFINEHERLIIQMRLNVDDSSISCKGIEWGGVKRGLRNWHAYILAVIYSSMNLNLGSVSGFLPTLVRDLGYTDARAQLLTVPPYAVACVLMLSVCIASDRAKTRGPFAAMVFVTSLIGWSILFSPSYQGDRLREVKFVYAAVHSHLHVRYFATFFVVSGGYCAIPLLISWTSNNAPTPSQRATQLGMLNSIGQILSMASAFLFPSEEGPKYGKGTAANAVSAALALMLILFVSSWFRYENRRRDLLGCRPTEDNLKIQAGEMYDLAPDFRYTT